jgi:hypothetical protein
MYCCYNVLHLTTGPSVSAILHFECSCTLLRVMNVAVVIWYILASFNLGVWNP